MESTQIIVLKKTAYRENSWILNGISPDYGRLSLVFAGPRKSDEGTATADLYREFEVEFNYSEKSELQNVSSLELFTNFDAVAENPKNLTFLARIGDFLLKNAAENLPMPYTYDAMRNVLCHLLLPPETPGRWTMLESSVVIKIVYLSENGLLPECADAKQNELWENLVAAGVENTALPQVKGNYIESLNRYLSELMQFHHLAR
ncbi:MAG: recombination protein O N-terminal domain-containing protein [Victivallaceae bacterium]|nr:recombination protein O N-terminal domain-containing protein [Victivallaceae bacterium]